MCGANGDKALKLPAHFKDISLLKQWIKLILKIFSQIF